jgi:hypothetical protein
VSALGPKLLAALAGTSRDRAGGARGARELLGERSASMRRWPPHSLLVGGAADALATPESRGGAGAGRALRRTRVPLQLGGGFNTLVRTAASTAS